MSSPQGSSWPPANRAWALVGLLLVAYAIAFVDRQILTLLVEPIKRDLGITDTQFSLLAGAAFTLFYTGMGIPLAWLADRGSRRNLIIASLVVWSAMTAVCGLVRTFGGLFLARIGVGIGEAGLSPAAYSMIADSFPPEKRARPMAVYSIGAVLGVGLALIIGGVVIHWASSAPPVTLPIVGELKTWQLALILVAVPGPLLAAVFLFMREPARHEAPKKADGSAGPSLKAFMRERGTLFVLLAFGFSLIGVTIAAYLSWTPAFMIRSHGWSVTKVGTIYGAVLLVFSTAGILLGASIVERFAPKGAGDTVLLVTIAGCALALPLAIVVPFVAAGGIAMALIAVMHFLFGIAQGLPMIAFQAIAENRIRARVIAIYLLVGNLVGFTIGPTGVALISDYGLGDPAKIGVAIAILACIVTPLGLLALQLARGRFIEAAAAVRE